MPESREIQQQREAVEAIMRAGLRDLVGQKATPETLALLKQRVEARWRIIGQLIEHEHEEVHHEG